MKPIESWTISRTIPKDLLIAKERIYNACDFDCTLPQAEIESTDYKANTFKINRMIVKYREAKITPKKIGQFVTLWKRNGNGPIEPFDISDTIDLFIVSVRNNNFLGQFIFPKSVLHEKKILSDHTIEGKRAIRVYPPWDTPTSQQAQKTQQWQIAFFLEIPKEKPVNLNLAKKLFKNQ